MGFKRINTLEELNSEIDRLLSVSEPSTWEGHEEAVELAKSNTAAIKKSTTLTRKLHLIAHKITDDILEDRLRLESSNELLDLIITVEYLNTLDKG